MHIGIVISSVNDQANLSIRKQLPEPHFYEQLSLHGDQLNQYVYVFKAHDYNKNKKTLSGYRFNNGQWHKLIVPLPDIVIDRTFHPTQLSSRRHHAYMDLLSKHHKFLFFNANLPNKLTVYDALKINISTVIPPSQQYEHFSQLEQLLGVYEDGVILKPLAGMQGRGSIHIRKKNELYYIKGRLLSNQSISTTCSSRIMLQKWLLHFKNHTSYLIQPYYHFKTTQQEPYDIRVLMQKDGHGIWQQSGCAARIGTPLSLTSNLHGGGQKRSSSEVLTELFGEQTTSAISKEIEWLSEKVAEQIESNFGRFGELALDFGITPEGKILLLECNSKPGRQAFCHNRTYQLSVITLPLAYSNYLFNHYLKHEDSATKVNQR